eukprot:6833419-Ditylum_brightwellii.AAC.1
MTKSDDGESIFFDEENKDNECVEQDDDDGSLNDAGSVVTGKDQKLFSSRGRLSLNPKLPPRTANYGTTRKLKLKSPSFKKKNFSHENVLFNS